MDLGEVTGRTWSRPDLDLLRADVREVLARAVTGGVTSFTVEALICAAAHIDQDLRPWLAFLDTLTGTDADTGVAALAQHWAEEIVNGREPELGWSPEDPAAPIRAWLYSDVLHERLSGVRARDAQIAIAYM